MRLLKAINDFVVFILMLLIKVYQKVISPFFPAVCRYSPTCSKYALTALQKHGPIKGSYLAARRILSCHPWSKRHHHDPVP